MANQRIKRLHLEVTGIVQGVGFRPFCFQLAQRLNLTGWVLNHGGGVSLEVQGAAIEAFVEALTAELPPLARIDSIKQKQATLIESEEAFTIQESQQSRVSSAIPPDADVCPECLKDLFNPESRYYRYPFLNCTHCGPRYTVTRHLPYDRAQTSLAEFPMCDGCHRDYSDPLDRRFHAQPTACPACGPQLDTPVAEIVECIKKGDIIALKGLGGFHLICDAHNQEAVQTLRQRKNREEKPFAIMAANLLSLRKYVEIDSPTEQLLTSAHKPIVLAPKTDNSALAEGIAPGLKWLGVMLPYTPLHHLLFNQAAGAPDGCDWLDQENDLVLVMTSANPGGEPLVTGNEEAHKRLTGIADSIICHDREIVTRADDSVMRIINGRAGFIRRARGYVPRAIKLPHEIPPTLALGGYLKNTVCITRGDEAFISQHIGDMDNSATIRFFEETVGHMLETLEVEPEIVAHDLHPDFYSTRFAVEFGKPTVAVQHHHAHLAAIAAEHHISGSAVGIALDGFGLGENNGAWGGELMMIDGAEYQRIGNLTPLKQPGGDKAAREPWRMASAAYQALKRGDEIEQRFAAHPAAGQLSQMMNKGLNSPETSSAGRLFDAAAGLLGVKEISSFEGQAPMLLEGMVTKPKALDNGWLIENGLLDIKPLLTQLISLNGSGRISEGADLFHGTLIAALTDWAEQAALANNTNTILLGGGCFLNHVLASGVVSTLSEKGFKVFSAQQAPVNDGGISLGQAWVAANHSTGS